MVIVAVWMLASASALTLLAVLVFALGYSRAYDAYAHPTWVDIPDGAKHDCPHCRGLGWVPVYDEHALTHCSCAASNKEIVRCP